MIILEHGINYETVECPHCYVKIGYLKYEIQYREFPTGYYAYLDCPECPNLIILDGDRNEQ